MGRKTYHCKSLYRQPSLWFKEPKSLRVVEKRAYKRVQYEKLGESQEDYWIGDNSRERYSQNWSERIYTIPPRIRKNEIVSLNSPPSKSRLHINSKWNKRSSTSWPDRIPTSSR